MCVIEIRAMVDGGLFGGCTTEDLWPPGVEVRIEVDDADGSVGLVDRAEKGKSDSVVAAKSDQTR